MKNFLILIILFCLSLNMFSQNQLTIGQSYQGGKIAYILKPGDTGYDSKVQHGLIAAPKDQASGSSWGCHGNVIIGADGTAIGTGNKNTIDIMAKCSTAGIAARMCGDLVLGGYSDWYLPSKDELNQLYKNRIAIGGFSNTDYRSSSEYSNYTSWGQYFDNGTQYYNNSKEYYDYFNVRAVRSF